MSSPFFPDLIKPRFFVPFVLFFGVALLSADADDASKSDSSEPHEDTKSEF